MRTWLLAVVVAVAPLGAAAQAPEFCDKLKQVVDLTPNGFSSIQARPGPRTSVYATVQVVGELCSVTVGRIYSCVIGNEGNGVADWKRLTEEVQACYPLAAPTAFKGDNDHEGATFEVAPDAVVYVHVNDLALTLRVSTKAMLRP